MIHTIEEKTTLPALENYEPPKISSSLKILGFVLPFLFSMLVLPFVLIGVLFINFYSYLTSPRKKEEVHEDTEVAPEDEILVEETYDERSSWLHVRMNHRALAEFISGIEEIYGGTKQQEPLMFNFKSKIKIEDQCYHAHSDFFFPALEHEITIGTGKGLFMLYAGDEIYASREIWQKAITEWRKVLRTRKPTLIVLDRFQSPWCDSQSRGRFSIEYLPDLAPSANKDVTTVR